MYGAIPSEIRFPVRDTEVYIKRDTFFPVRAAEVYIGTQCFIFRRNIFVILAREAEDCIQRATFLLLERQRIISREICFVFFC